MGNCSAPALWDPLANAPLAGLKATVSQFQTLGVAPKSLVLGLPFYGIDYPCSSSVSGAPCQVFLESTGAVWPGCKGCPSHLPGGSCARLDYDCNRCGQTIQALLEAGANTTNVRYDSTTASAMFEYFNHSSSRRHLVSFDDAHTLGLKSAWAKGVGVRGAGVYEIGMVDLSSSSGMGMWDAIAAGWIADTATAPLPARIVVADDATESELWAADKLAELLVLPTDNAIGTAGTAQIAVGYGAAAALGVPAGALLQLDDDSFLVATTRWVPRGSVAIASSSHSARGSIHGVYTFVRALGFEFFAENVTRVPSLLPSL